MGTIHPLLESHKVHATFFLESQENHMSSCVDKHNVFDLTGSRKIVLFLQSSSSLRQDQPESRLRSIWRADFLDSLCSLTVGRFVVGDLDDSRLRLSGVFNKVQVLWLRIHEPDYRTLRLVADKLLILFPAPA